MKSKTSQKFGYNISNILRLKRQLVDAILKQDGFTRSEWQTLAWLYVFDHCCSQQQLQEYLAVDRAHLTRILDRLEKKKIITRKMNPLDKRSRIVSVNSRSKQQVEKIYKTLVSIDSKLFHGVDSSTKKIFFDVLEKVNSNVELEYKKYF